MLRTVRSSVPFIVNPASAAEGGLDRPGAFSAVGPGIPNSTICMRTSAMDNCSLRGAYSAGI